MKTALNLYCIVLGIFIVFNSCSKSNNSPASTNEEYEIIEIYEYEEVYEPVEVWEDCNHCYGSGQCGNCGGQGVNYIYGPYGPITSDCVFCTNGVCQYCHGKGGRYSTKY